MTDFAKTFHPFVLDLQDRFCAMLESFETQSRFESREWQRPEGHRLQGGGRSRLMRGEVLVQGQKLYDLPLVQDIDDVYAQENVSDVLQIKTHYEGLDIAASNKVHYLQFGLPATTLPDKEDELKNLLREEESDRRR